MISPSKKLALILCVLPNILLAQSAFVDVPVSDFMNRVNKNNQLEFNQPDIEGTPYLNEEFIDGAIYYDGKYRIPSIPLRVNLYNDAMEYKDKNTILAVAKPERIDKIIIDDQTFIYLKKKNKSEVSGYVRKWNESFPSVISKMQVKFMPKEEPRPFEEAEPDRFVRQNDKHYLLFADGEISEIKLVKKLIKLLGDHQNELTDFSKEKKVSKNDAEELSKLLDYYHSLE
jgi:hypothetical protein